MNPRPRTKSDLPPRLQVKHTKSGVTHYYWTPYENGKLRWVPLGADHIEAMRRYSELEAERRGDVIISMMLERYLEHTLILSERTRRDYRLYADTLTKLWGSLPLSSLTPSTIARWLENHSAPISANRHIAMLSSAYSWAQRQGLVDANPCIGIRRNPERKRKHVATREDVERILTMPATDPVRLAAELSLITALRKSDILGLTVKSVTDEGLMVFVNKNRVWRLFSWSAELRDVVNRCQGYATEWLIHTKEGRRYTESGFNTQRRRRWREYGITCTFHDLRARAITDARFLWGRDIAQDIAAHEDGSTTERYVRDRAAIVVPPIPLKRDNE